MKFIIIYIYNIIIQNIGKIILLSIALISLFINVYVNSDSEYTYVEKVITKFEANGHEYLVIYDRGMSDDFRIEKMRSDYVFNNDGEIVSKSHSWYFVLFIILFITSFVIFLFCPVFYGGGWEFKRIYYDCLSQNVKLKVDEDDDKIYYIYRGRILKEIPNTYWKLSRYDIIFHIKRCKISPNLYEKFLGTKREIRERKLKYLK